MQYQRPFARSLGVTSIRFLTHIFGDFHIARSYFHVDSSQQLSQPLFSPSVDALFFPEIRPTIPDTALALCMLASSRDFHRRGSFGFNFGLQFLRFLFLEHSLLEGSFFGLCLAHGFELDLSLHFILLDSLFVHIVGSQVAVEFLKNGSEGLLESIFEPAADPAHW